MANTPARDTALAAAVAEVFGPAGALAREHPGYVARAEQEELAAAVADAIETRGALVAEAGTGTGKTFAYLAPALLSGARVLISTGTRNLQDQLFSRDLPEMARMLGVRVDAALLKGRANYVCWHHLQRNLAEGRFARRQDIAELHRIQRFAVTSPTGDRAGFPGVPEDAPVWAMATSTRENCLGQDCPELARCFVVRARQAAQRAEVVVVNHHLFCADLALRDEGVADLLPTADALIFDEAHQLPSVATQFFGASVSTRRLLDFSRDLLRAGHAEARDSADWTSLSRALEQSVRELRLHAGPGGRVEGRDLCARPGWIGALAGCVRAVAAAGGALERAAERGREVQLCALRATELAGQILAWLRSAAPERVADVGPDLEPPESPPAGDTADAWQQALAAARGDPDSAAAGGVSAFDEDVGAERGRTDAAAGTGAGGAEEAEQGDDAENATITWAEIHTSALTLHATPLSVAPAFRRQLAARPRAWVFLSATLAVSGGFSHYASVMGLETARQQVWQSPFDYANQALLYVPQGIGPPSGADFPRRMADAIAPLLLANEGRAFVLCTTLRMVERLAGLLGERLAGADLPIELLVQGSASRAELVERFRAARAPVLIGSASFWEGVDVPGRQLSLVVIDKLPFAPPDDPVLRARIDAARRAGEDPFRTLQLPAAAMALKQGAGRLIRSEIDRGLLIVCDDRLAEKAYGRTLLRSLPPFRRTRSRDDALAFIDGFADADADAAPDGSVPGAAAQRAASGSGDDAAAG